MADALSVLLGLIAGLKIAVFIVVSVYIKLADIPFKKKGTYWLELVAFSFIILAFAEFLHFMGDIDSSYALLPWFLVEENLSLFMTFCYFIAAVGILFFLLHLKKNIKDYRSTFL